MTVSHVRSANTFMVAVFVLLGLASQQVWFQENIQNILLWGGLLTVTLVYTLLYWLEPAIVYWRHRDSSPVFEERVPLELVLMQHSFGVQLKEIIEYKKRMDRPAYAIGNSVFPCRLYLRQGLDKELNLQQLQGMFASQLADLSIARAGKLWLSGGAGIGILLFILILIILFRSEGAVSNQLFFSFAPFLVLLLDFVIVAVSRRLTHASDLRAAQTLVYPNYLLRYLEALGHLEAVHKEMNPDLAPGLIKLPIFRAPYPTAAERLEYLGRFYPEAQELKEKLLRQLQEKTDI